MRTTTTLIIFALLASCFNVAAQSRYEVVKTPFSTKKYDEFSPVPFEGGLVFCSNRRIRGLISHRDKHNKDLLNIYKVILEENLQQIKPELFSRNLVTRFNDGPLAFDPGGNSLVYSRNIDFTAQARNVTNSGNKLGLFFARKEDGAWITTSAFKYNSSAYSITTPCFNPDGQTLYFGSDMPGGYGGADLYRSTLIDGTWGEPENLGDQINTPGNEVYPFISGSGQLYFASDGHGGLGKKDLFLSEQKDAGWSEPVPLEAPINSAEDDFGLFTNEDLTEGYFSSDRNSGKDIYQFSTVIPRLFNCPVLRKNKYCYEFWDEQAQNLDTVQAIYEWEFSDGSKVTGLRIEHCFPGAGMYWAKLNIIDNSTKETFMTQTSIELKIVDHVQPYITSMDTTSISTVIPFSGLESNLPGFTIGEYIWDFGDGTHVKGPEVDHRFNEAGIYEVKMGVRVYHEDKTEGEIRCVSKRITVLAEDILLD